LVVDGNPAGQIEKSTLMSMFNHPHERVTCGFRRKAGKATQLLRDADGLLITAGAGMGVDPGLPDFRGVDGSWHAYPALQHHGLSFEDMANPASFSNDPTLAWGFYGHRLALYRKTKPHTGFDILRKWGARMLHGAFAFTSNVDGQF